MSNKKMKRLFRRAERALTNATEAETAGKDDSTLVAKAASGFGDRDGLGKDATGRDCTESIRAQASFIVASRRAFNSLKIAFSRANNAMA